MAWFYKLTCVVMHIGSLQGVVDWRSDVRAWHVKRVMHEVGYEL